MSIDVSGIKEGQRKMWTIGDYPDIARTLLGTPAGFEDSWRVSRVWWRSLSGGRG